MAINRGATICYGSFLSRRDGRVRMRAALTHRCPGDGHVAVRRRVTIRHHQAPGINNFGPANRAAAAATLTQIADAAITASSAPRVVDVGL
jgi:hypothetical protein